MNPFRHWKIILSLAVIFAAGAATGGLLTFKVIKEMVRARTSPDRWSSQTLEDYERQLDLTPEQVEKIRPLVEQAGQDMKRHRMDFGAQMMQIFRQANEQIVAELTPEQRAKFDRFRREQRMRLPGGRPPGPPMPGGRPPASGQGPGWLNGFNQRPLSRPSATNVETRGANRENQNEGGGRPLLNRSVPATREQPRRGEDGGAAPKR